MDPSPPPHAQIVASDSEARIQRRGGRSSGAITRRATTTRTGQPAERTHIHVYTKDSGEMSHAPLEAMMAKMIGTLANSDDVKVLSHDLAGNIDGLGHSLDDMIQRIDGVSTRVDAVDQDMTDWKSDADKDIQHMKGKVARTTASPGEKTREQPAPVLSASWMARVFHVRGWSPEDQQCGRRRTSSTGYDEERPRVHRMASAVHAKSPSDVPGATNANARSVSDRVGKLLKQYNIRFHGEISALFWMPDHSLERRSAFGTRRETSSTH